MLTPRGPIPRMDAMLAAVLMVAGCVALALDPVSQVARDASRPVLLVTLTLVMTGAVAWRRVVPVPAVVLSGLAALAAVAAGYGISLGALCTWALLGSAALHTDRRTSIGLGILGAVGVATGVYDANPMSRDVLNVLTSAGVGTLPPLVGDALRRQRELTEEVVRLRQAELEAAAREERVRIARDLHDTVGHHLGAIGLQARAGELVASDGDAAGAGANLETIARLSDRALEDTRVLLGVLREEDTGTLRPTPRLEDLDELVETAASAGVRVLVDADAVPDLPGPISTSMFRIAQEALTNVARHAGPAGARVEVRRGAGRVRLTVTDDGRGGGAASGGTGLGLAGMRERASAVGGTLEAGPRPEGGWRVHADLPERL